MAHQAQRDDVRADAAGGRCRGRRGRLDHVQRHAARNRHQRVLRHRVPLARRVHLPRLQEVGALRQPHRRERGLFRLPHPEGILPQALHQGDVRHPRRLRRVHPAEDLHPREVRGRTAAHVRLGARADEGARFEGMPQLPRLHARGHRQAGSRRAGDPSEDQGNGPDLRRLPHRRRALGARPAEARHAEGSACGRSAQAAAKRSPTSSAASAATR